VVLSIFNEDKVEIDSSKIKSIISIKSNHQFLCDYQIQIIFWIAEYYFCQIHHALNLFFPKNLKEKIKKDTLDLSKIKTYNYTFNTHVLFSKEQEKAYQKIKHSKQNKILFYGLTGSGKTEIYIRLIKEIIDS